MSEEVVPENIVELNLNNVLAGIVKTMGSVVIPIENILADYANQSLAVAFDDDNGLLELSLVDNSEIVEENNES